MNFLISKLADVTSKERAMLDECEALLASIGAMQVSCLIKILFSAMRRCVKTIFDSVYYIVVLPFLCLCY